MEIITTLNSFVTFLTSKHLSPNTIRNYKADINAYLDWANTNHLLWSSTHCLHAYIQSLSSDNNQKRKLASINIFCQFCQSQNLVSSNFNSNIPKKTIGQHQSTISKLIFEYQN